MYSTWLGIAGKDLTVDVTGEDFIQMEENIKYNGVDADIVLVSY